MDHPWFRWIIFVLMIGIVFSLGSGLYFILFEKEKSDKAVKSLSIRISLSLGLFILLFLSFAMGWITPHDWIRTNKQTQIKTTTPHPQSASTMLPPQNQNDVQE